MRWHRAPKLPLLVPGWLSVAQCPSPGVLSSTDPQGLPVEKRTRSGELSNIAFCTARHNICTNKYGLSELMEAS